MDGWISRQPDNRSSIFGSRELFSQLDAKHAENKISDLLKHVGSSRFLKLNLEKWPI
jgi:hypothetical protein